MPDIETIQDFIEREGEPVLLRRSGVATVTVQAFIRGYSPNPLVDNLIQGDRVIQISNREISAVGWPGPPRKGDQVVIDGRTTTVQDCETRKFRGEIAKYIIQVTG